jgi:glycosyltransferase involved in cell wall biosynthesis
VWLIARSTGVQQCYLFPNQTLLISAKIFSIVEARNIQNINMNDHSNTYHVLQIIPDMGTGGAEKTTLDIGNELVRLGWTSTVASNGGRLVAALEAGGSTHLTLRMHSKNPLRIIANGFKLARIIKAQNVHIIHARSRAPAWSALIAARLTGVGFVTTYHGAYSQTNKLKALYNSVMARADTVIANSHWTADLIAQRHPWSKDKIVSIHRGTDFNEFAPDAISKARVGNIQQSWDISKDDFVVLKLARLTDWKGQKYLIEAVGLIIDRHPNLKLVLAGDAQGRTAYKNQLLGLIEKHKLQERVILPGHCDDPAAAMACANAVVVASTDAEAFGRAAVEASAFEKPLIVTRIGAVVETVLSEPEVQHDEITGWKVAPANAQELADALSELLQMTQAQQHAVGKRARAHVTAHFSLEHMCSKTMAVYQALMQKKRRI